MEVVIGLERSALLYDIGNYLFIEGETLRNDAGVERHLVQDGCEDGNVDRVNRVIDLAVARARDLLYPYCSTPFPSPQGRGDVLDVVLDLPVGVSGVSVDLLGKALHEYVVCRAVADWLSITNAAKAEVWLVKAAEAEQDVRMSLNWRMARVRRGVAPFG